MSDFWINYLPIIICTLAGTGLIIVEALMPGFGLPGISGIVLYLGGVVWAYTHLGTVGALILLLIEAAIGIIAAVVCLRSVAKGRLNSIVLSDKEKGDDEDANAGLVGKEGAALTVLRPTGSAMIDGKKYDVLSDGDFIPVNAKIRVKETQGSKIIVSAIQND